MQIAMIAADFTGGEADGLRRAMAAWKHQGGLGHDREMLVGRMIAKGCDAEFSERSSSRSRASVSTVSPKATQPVSRNWPAPVAGSSTITPMPFSPRCSTASPWAFRLPHSSCAMRAHGVEVRPVDVMASAVESTLELLPSLGPLRAVRLGFDRVAGLSADAGRRIVDARAATRFISPEDLTRRAALNAHELQCLAQADALCALTGHRHQAAWAVANIDTRPTPMLRESRVDELAVELPALAEAEETLADYRAHGRTLNRHPLALLREQPAPVRMQPADVLRAYPNGRLGRASGPRSRKHRCLSRFEDDTGTDQRDRLAGCGRFAAQAAADGSAADPVRPLAAPGRAAKHLVVMKAIDHSDLLQGLVSRSRNFR